MTEKRNRKKRPIKKKANEKVDRARLNKAFATFQRGESFALTKQRIDMVWYGSPKNSYEENVFGC